METSELLKKVRQIEIKTRGLSNNIFAGQYHSAFKGRGMAFSEVREYQFGDDTRDIDWKVTARYVRPYVKVFEEERELTVMLLIDVSGSKDFGTVSQMKRDVTTEIAATLAFSAIQNNDKIGVIFFSDKIEKFIPPQKGRRHILYIIRELIDFRPDDRQTDINQALKYLTNAIKKRCTAFLLSDFIDHRQPQARHRSHPSLRPPRDGAARRRPDEGARRRDRPRTMDRQLLQTSARSLPHVVGQTAGGDERRLPKEPHRRRLHPYGGRLCEGAAGSLR